MLGDIDAAKGTVRFESYIFAASPVGERFLAGLVRASQRGVQVRVLIDAFGSLYLPDAFWNPLREAGGEFRWFNPLTFAHFGFRNHRKLLVVDHQAAIVGGFNIAPEYEGDGVERGWRDLGLRVTGPLAKELAQSFDAMFGLADVRHDFFSRLRRPRVPRRVTTHQGMLLQSGPGRGEVSFRNLLRRDLSHGHAARILSAYFLPTWRIRRELLHMARKRGGVQLVLAAKSDVALARLACQRLYQGMLKAGIQIYEYQPQVLHAKLVIIDDLVYVGSANLDVRSLRINYELMLRLRGQELVEGGASIFAETLAHSQRIDPVSWRSSRTFWRKLKEHWAFLILGRLDPFLIRRQLRKLR